MRLLFKLERERYRDGGDERSEQCEMAQSGRGPAVQSVSSTAAARRHRRPRGRR